MAYHQTGGGSISGSQAFAQAVLSPTDEKALIILPTDYGTIYQGQGTSDAYRFFTGQGSQDTSNILIQGTSRSDLTFGQGYNCNSSGTQVRSDEPAFLRNTEFGYYIPTSVSAFNLTGAPSYNSGTGLSTVTASSVTPFTSTMVNTCAVRFATSKKAYPIVEYVSTSVVRVRGDASAESLGAGQVSLYVRGMETYDQVMFPDGTTFRTNDVSYLTHNKQVRAINRATSFSFQRENQSELLLIGGSAIGDLDVKVQLGHLYLSTNAKNLYGINFPSAGSVTSMIGFDAQGTLSLGQNTLTNGIRMGGPGILSSDDTVGILMGSASGTAGGAQGVAKYMQFVGAAYGADGIRPRMYTDADHISMRLPRTGDADPTAKLLFGTGTASSQDTNLYRAAANVLATDDDFRLVTEGKGLQVKEGATNGRMGKVTLGTGGTNVVTCSGVTASSRIFLTAQVVGGTPGFLYVSARDGSGFTIQSSNAADRSEVAYLIVEAV